MKRHWQILFLWLLPLCLVSACSPLGLGTPGGAGDEITSVILTRDAPVYPFINIKQVITLHADGRGELTDYEMYNMEEEGGLPYPPGEAPVLAHYAFRIPVSTFSTMAQAVFACRFFQIPEDYGEVATDSPYSYITVKTEDAEHTVASMGWPKELSGLVSAIRDALSAAYFEQEPKYAALSDTVITHTLISYNLVDTERITVWETTLSGDGTKEVFEYGPFSPPLSAMGLDFPRDGEPLTHYKGNLDLNSYGELLKAVEDNGFFSMPEILEATDNGEPIDLSGGANQITFLTVSDGENERTVSFTGYIELYAPKPFVAIYDALTATEASKEPPDPIKVESIFAW